MAAQILVDCASGGTKMYLALQRAETSHVSNTEVGSMPPVLGSLRAAREANGSSQPVLVAEFRQNLDVAIARLAELAADVSLQAVVIGLTTWWRHLEFSERVEVYDLLLKGLKEVAEEVAPCRFEPLSDNKEIVLEQEAVAYAARNILGYKDVDLVVSGGNTSINLVPAGKYQTPSHSVGLNILVGQDVVQKRGPEVWSSECFVQVDRAAGLYCKELLNLKSMPDRITVIAIGSNYWGGRDAGLANSLEEHPLLEVFDRLQARLDMRLTTRSEGWAKECANLMRLRICLTRLFPKSLHDLVSVVFARDWVVNGEPFRTTWTSGYFIRHAGLATPAATPRRANSEWVSKLGSSWLDLSSRDSGDAKKVVCFDDAEDNEMHEVPYSSRMRLIDVISAMPLSRHAHSAWGVAWTRAAMGPQPISRPKDGHPVGVQVSLPSADGSSRFVVVGLVSAPSVAGGSTPSAPSTLPRPALGFNRRLKDMFPVVDLGIVFDAKAHMVTLQTGAVQMKAEVVLGSRDVPWDSKAEATYHVWLEELAGRVYLRFAADRRIPTAVDSAGVQGWRYDIGKSELVLPAAVHIWVGFGNSLKMTRSTSMRPNSPAAAAQGTTTAAAWNDVSFNLLDRVPGGCGWATGRAWDACDRSVARVRNCIYRYLPRWVARSFARHHVGEDGVRRLAVWPAYGQEREPGLCVVATAGEFEVWAFSEHGEGLYHCTFEKAKVWSVAILGLRRIRGQGAAELRLLVGCVQGDRMLCEQLVTIDDPGNVGRCKLVERTVAYSEHQQHEPSAWTGRSGLQGHTEAVTGIFVDSQRGLVYTVSYDKTAIQWDASGRLLHQARGFHREKIYNGALSAGGCWLATAGFDHVALFSADAEQGLSCVALVDHDWENPDMDRRWFAASFLPRSLVEERESTSELPSAMLIGDMHGNMWLVSLLQRDGTRRRPDGMTRFVSAVNDGVSLLSHGDCIRQFCWVEANSLEWSTSISQPSLWRRRGLRACCSCCRRSSPVQDEGATSASSVSCSRETLKLPLLCSTSSDRTVRIYDAKDMWEAYESLTAMHRTPSQGSWPSPVKASSPSARIPMALDDVDDEPVSYAVEIAFHEAPVRAAGVDGFGHLYTASRRLAKWDDVLEFHWGDRVLQPKLLVREAFYLEVVFYFTNLFVFALQLLYFSCNRGVFATDSSAKSAVSPLASITAVSVLESWGFLPNVRPFWRASVSLWVATMVVLCPKVLRAYHDAALKYDMDINDHNNRRKVWWKMIWCYTFVFVIFGLLVIPTFKEFAVLLYCPMDANGVPRMAADVETVCFVGTHLALTVICVTVGGLYLACGLLFETVNFDLSSLLESKLGAVAAFPTNRGTKAFGDEPATGMTTRDISVRRFFYVMFRHLIPDINLEPPLVSTGVFTQTSWAVHSRHMCFISKVMLAFVDRMSSEWVLWQMIAVVSIAVANLLVNFALPPLLAPQLKWGIVVVQVSLVVASCIALVAMTGSALDVPPVVLAVTYLIAVLSPLLAYAISVPLRCCKCSRTSGGARQKVALSQDSVEESQEAPQEAARIEGGEADAQPRLAWERPPD